MIFELGKYYAVHKTDNTIITFRFVGGEPPCGEINGERIALAVIFNNGFNSYWEVHTEL